MPRYFFDLTGERVSRDEEGVECADLDRAKIEAIRLMGEILREDAEAISYTQDCGVVVRDSRGRPLAQVQTSIGATSDASASSPLPRQRRRA